MSFFTHQKESALDSDDNHNHMGFFYIGVSILAHLFFLIAMLFLQNLHFTKPLPPVIQVELISFAPEPVFEDLSSGQEETVQEKVVDPAADITPETKEVKAIPKKSPPKEVEIKKPDISLKTKPKNLQELIDNKQKKEEKKPVKKVEKPKEEKTEEPGDETDEQIAIALSRLEKLVQAQNQNKTDQNSDSQGKGSSQGTGKKNYTPIDLYNMVLASAITQNWVFNDRLANMDKTLETTVLITILKNGELREVFFETRSGNNYLDESAEKAIRKANPLPELPKGYSSYTVGLIFTPKGLK